MTWNKLLRTTKIINQYTTADYYIVSVSDIWISDVRNFWISRLVCKSSADTLGPDISSQEPRPRIWRLVYKFRLKPWFGHEDPRPRISDVPLDMWNSDIRHVAVIFKCILIILISFYLVNSKTKFDETLDRISDPKNFGRGFEY